MDIKKESKKWKRRNLVLNTGLCLGSVAVFGFNPIAICACYIGSDIVLTLINEFIDIIWMEKRLLILKSS